MSDGSEGVGGGGGGTAPVFTQSITFQNVKLKLWDVSLLKPLWTPF